MGSETEPAKLLLPFLQRADELQKHELLVAYYCRLYAMERGLKIPPKERTKTTNALLVSLMKQLEKDKKSLKLGPEDNLYVEGFALNVFAKADKQDRAGRADLNTAKTFYAASIFFEILNQFGELQPDLEQKQKYAVWKAAEIRKALKEGRRPEPGPPGGGEDLSIPSILPTSTQDVRDIETFPANQPKSSISSPTVDTNHDQKPSTNTPTSTPSYSKADYPSHSLQSPPSPPLPPPSNRPEQSYPQSYDSYQPQQPSYSHDQNYPSHDDTSAYNYSNFQSYPSFNENNLPTAPGHYNYYQGSDAAYQSSSAYSHQSSPVAPDYPSTVPYKYGAGTETVHPGSVYSNQSGPLTSKYSSTAPYNPGHVNDTHPGGVTPPPAQPFSYDVNYVPPPEKISEALKSAKLAVGALAFDEVGPAVDYLKRSLELLTKSSASH